MQFKTIDRTLISIENVLDYIAAFCLAVIIVLIGLDVAGRIFGFLIQGAVEISGYMLVPITFLPISYALRNGHHVRVEGFLCKLSPSVRLKFEIVLDVITLLIIVILLVESWGLGLQSWNRDLVSNTMLRLPLYISQLPIVVGLFFFGIEMVLVIVRNILSPGGQ